MNTLPSTEEETAKGGEEEPSLEVWVHEVDSFEIALDIDRNRLVDRSNGRDPGEVLAPLHGRVQVHHGERPLLQLLVYLLLQVPLQHMTAHEPSWRSPNQSKPSIPITHRAFGSCHFSWKNDSFSGFPHCFLDRKLLKHLENNRWETEDRNSENSRQTKTHQPKKLICKRKHKFPERKIENYRGKVFL